MQPGDIEANVESSRFWAFLDRAGRLFMLWPDWSALAVLLALTLLPVTVWLDLHKLSNKTLTRQATDLNAIVQDTRSYYARNPAPHSGGGVAPA